MLLSNPHRQDLDLLEASWLDTEWQRKSLGAPLADGNGIINLKF